MSAGALGEIERLRARRRNRTRALAALGLVAAAGLAATLLASQFALAATALATIALVLVGGRQSVDRARLNVACDDALLAGGAAAESAEARARAQAVTSPGHRAALAAFVDELVRIADERLDRASRPVQLDAVRESRSLLAELAGALRDRNDPDPAAVVRIERLVRAPDSPLRDPGGAEAFRREARGALAALRAA